ncbi:uncharacterized protein LOC143919239 [Arctopsyche grandis]|uniref:uncharacterized protein LOC143919239 n=1 Tax=Arctopsyche grandis TaxID=121162 RepID=UPI00406D7E19
MLRVSFLLLAMLASVFAGDGALKAIPGQLNLRVPQQLKVGDEIELQLQLRDDVKSFTVNLVSEFDKDGAMYNTNYHHRVDVPENRVILTCRIDGVWQYVTQTILDTSPVHKGERFKMSMYLGQDGIYTAVKNQLNFYPHRIPMANIKWVTITDSEYYKIGTGFRGICKIETIRLDPGTGTDLVILGVNNLYMPSCPKYIDILNLSPANIRRYKS